MTLNAGYDRGGEVTPRPFAQTRLGLSRRCTNSSGGFRGSNGLRISVVVRRKLGLRVGVRARRGAARVPETFTKRLFAQAQLLVGALELRACFTAELTAALA